MPTEADYVGALISEAQSIMDFPADTKYDVNKHAAEARRRINKKRDEFTKEITNKWKTGFAALKAENDQMQKDLMMAHKEADQWVFETRAHKYEGIQK